MQFKFRGTRLVRRQTHQLTRLRLESLEDRRMLAAPPSGDLAEGNADQWSTFASDGAATEVVDDVTRVQVGNQSIRFTTGSGFDTGVRYPRTADAHWDLTTRNYLTFWAYAENNTPIGFQGPQPVVVLKSPGGSFRYTPTDTAMTNFSWRLYKIPLAGDSFWVRTQTGSPTLSDVTQIEIHQDTWDYGFRITYDGVQFVSLDPGGLPPSGPQPPEGVNPDAIFPRALLYVFDPIMENFSGLRLHDVYGWQSPSQLTEQVVADFTTSSHGLVQFQVVETQIADVHPYFVDGFQHTDASFATAWAARDFHASQFDYVRFVAENNLAARVDAGEFDEIWIYAPPIAGMYESVMAGAGAYWINGPPQNVPSQRAFPIMGWNYERGVGEAIHSFGHRAESTMDHMYGVQSANRNNNWNKFTFQDRYQVGFGGVGNVHFPVNGQSDYDYFNERFVLSSADDWAYYPDFQGVTRSINAREWSPLGLDPQREYLNWWYGHLPHFAGRGTDYYLNNWWRYLVDIDQFKASNGNLYASVGIPSVSTTLPAHQSTVQGIVSVSARAVVDGALGRVDLYVDGVYYATDTLAPYTFAWDARFLSGYHTLVTKAYELQNGTEAVGASVTVNVIPRLIGDANGDFTVGAADYVLWAAQFGRSGAGLSADFDGNGNVGASDYALWAANFGKTSDGSIADAARRLTTTVQSKLSAPLSAARTPIRAASSPGAKFERAWSQVLISHDRVLTEFDAATKPLVFQIDSAKPFGPKAAKQAALWDRTLDKQGPAPKPMGTSHLGRLTS